MDSEGWNRNKSEKNTPEDIDDKLPVYFFIWILRLLEINFLIIIYKVDHSLVSENKSYTSLAGSATLGDTS